MNLTTLRNLLIVAIVVVQGCSRNLPNEKLEGQVKVTNDTADIKDRRIEMPAIPKFSQEFWINATPEILDSLKGKVVLFDFWEYTCVNCIRTLPYLKEWNTRYAGKGLLIIGIHAPEFEFGKKRENVEQAVRNFHLTYPIVLDNDYTIWTLFGNKYWPAKYIFDRNGILRSYHYGEGNYGETETTIQKLLREIDPAAVLPAVMEPVREEDRPGAVCYRSSPETYLGFEQGHAGNAEQLRENEIVEFTAPSHLKEDVFYLDGRWKCEPQSVHLASKDKSPGSILYNYAAAEVNLVIHPESERGFKVYVEQDGSPVPPASRGPDIKVESDGKTYLQIDQPRMYMIIKNAKFDRHSLKLTSNSNSFGAYAFTFTTMCEQPK